MQAIATRRFLPAGRGLPLLALLLLPDHLSPQFDSSPALRESAVIPYFQSVDPAIAHFRTVLRRVLDGTHSLVVVHGSRRQWPEDRWISLFQGDSVGVFVVRNARPELAWEIALMQGKGDHALEIECAGRDSIVFSRTDADYGIVQYWIKIYFDIHLKRRLRQFEFRPLGAARMIWGGDALYASIDSLGFPRERDLTVRVTQDGAVLATVVEAVEAPAALSKSAISDLDRYAFELEPLPQSSPTELADARSTGDSTERTVNEEIGPTQIAGNRLWFGKTFYDGEGAAGVGGFGYFDPDERRYVVFSPPAIRNWSVASLLVEDQVVWIGRYRRPEGVEYSGGLLRYDVESGEAREFDVGDVIRQIKRWGERVFLATDGGLYVLGADGRIARFVFAPSLEGETAAFPCEP